jgi:hypothetical protein
MNHLLTMFLAPDSSVSQATLTSPPAKKRPARWYWGKGKASAKFMAGVVMNAAGFGLLLAGSWFSVQLMYSVVG